MASSTDAGPEAQEVFPEHISILPQAMHTDRRVAGATSPGPGMVDGIQNGGLNRFSLKFEDMAARFARRSAEAWRGPLQKERTPQRKKRSSLVKGEYNLEPLDGTTDGANAKRKKSLHGIYGLLARHIDVPLAVWEARAEKAAGQKRRSIFGLPLLHPYSPVAVAWRCAMLLFDLTFTAFWVPLNVGFCYESYGDVSRPCTRSDLAGGAVYVVNCLIGFQMGVVMTCESRQAVLLDGPSVAYLYTAHGKFLMDVLSCIPFFVLIDTIAEPSHQHSNSWRLLSLLSLLRLVRMMRLFNTVKVVYKDSLSGHYRRSWVTQRISVSLMYLIILTFQAVVVVNLCAALMVMLAAYYGPGGPTWYDSMSWIEFETLSPSLLWYHAVYWVITVLTTTGQGQAPRQLGEQIVANFCSVYGMVLSGLVVGVVSPALLEATGDARALYKSRRKVGAVSQWARARHLPPSISKELQVYFADADMAHRESELARRDFNLEAALIDGLPSTLRREVVRNIVRPLVDKVHIFSRADPDLRDMLAERFRLVDVPPNHDLCRQGTEADRLWLVEWGTLAALRHHEPDAHPTTGMACLLGETVLLRGLMDVAALRPWTLRTSSKARLWELHWEDLEPLLRVYPRLISIKLQYVRQRMIHKLDAIPERDSSWCELVSVLTRILKQPALLDMAQDNLEALVQAREADSSLPLLLSAWLEAGVSTPLELGLGGTAVGGRKRGVLTMPTMLGRSSREGGPGAPSTNLASYHPHAHPLGAPSPAITSRYGSRPGQSPQTYPPHPVGSGTLPRVPSWGRGAPASPRADTVVAAAAAALAAEASGAGGLVPAGSGGGTGEMSLPWGLSPAPSAEPSTNGPRHGGGGSGSGEVQGVNVDGAVSGGGSARSLLPAPSQSGQGVGLGRGQWGMSGGGGAAAGMARGGGSEDAMAAAVVQSQQPPQLPQQQYLGPPPPLALPAHLHGLHQQAASAAGGGGGGGGSGGGGGGGGRNPGAPSRLSVTTLARRGASPVSGTSSPLTSVAEYPAGSGARELGAPPTTTSPIPSAAGSYRLSAQNAGTTGPAAAARSPSPLTHGSQGTDPMGPLGAAAGAQPQYQHHHQYHQQAAADRGSGEAASLDSGLSGPMVQSRAASFLDASMAYMFVDAGGMPVQQARQQGTGTGGSTSASVPASASAFGFGPSAQGQGQGQGQVDTTASSWALGPARPIGEAFEGGGEGGDSDGGYNEEVVLVQDNWDMMAAAGEWRDLSGMPLPAPSSPRALVAGSSDLGAAHRHAASGSQYHMQGIGQYQHPHQPQHQHHLPRQQPLPQPPQPLPPLPAHQQQHHQRHVLVDGQMLSYTGLPGEGGGRNNVSPRQPDLASGMYDMSSPVAVPSRTMPATAAVYDITASSSLLRPSLQLDGSIAPPALATAAASSAGLHIRRARPMDGAASLASFPVPVSSSPSSSQHYLPSSGPPSPIALAAGAAAAAAATPGSGGRLVRSASGTALSGGLSGLLPLVPEERRTAGFGAVAGGSTSHDGGGGGLDGGGDVAGDMSGCPGVPAGGRVKLSTSSGMVEERTLRPPSSPHLGAGSTLRPPSSPQMGVGSTLRPPGSPQMEVGRTLRPRSSPHTAVGSTLRAPSSPHLAGAGPGATLGADPYIVSGIQDPILAPVPDRSPPRLATAGSEGARFPARPPPPSEASMAGRSWRSRVHGDGGTGSGTGSSGDGAGGGSGSGGSNFGLPPRSPLRERPSAALRGRTSPSPPLGPQSSSQLQMAVSGDGGVASAASDGGEPGMAAAAAGPSPPRPLSGAVPSLGACTGPAMCHTCGKCTCSACRARALLAAQALEQGAAVVVAPATVPLGTAARVVQPPLAAAAVAAAPLPQTRSYQSPTIARLAGAAGGSLPGLGPARSAGLGPAAAGGGISGTAVVGGALAAFVGGGSVTGGGVFSAAGAGSSMGSIHVGSGTGAVPARSSASGGAAPWVRSGSGSAGRGPETWRRRRASAVMNLGVPSVAPY